MTSRATIRKVAVEECSSRSGRILANLPRWCFLAVLFYAPWAFGSTRPWTIQVLNISLGVCLCLWLVSCGIGRRWPRLPFLVLAPSALLIVQATWMTLNAGFIFHPDLKEFSVRSQFLSGAPGSIDYALSAEAGVSIALLLGTLLFITDCASDPLWRRRIIFTLVAAGTTLILFGLVQRLCSAPSIFWAAADTGKTFFATYRYHSNAGAFINMVWPLVTAGLLISVRRGQRFPQRLAWGIALTLCLVGLAVTGARAAGGIAIVSVLVALAWTVRQTRQGHLPALNLPVAISAAILCFLVVATAAATAGLDVSARRWNKVGELFSMQNPRLVVDEVCLKMIPDAGWFGFGPGTFCRAFPYYTNYLGDSISGVWMQAHQDYLQTIIEWGVVGALAWAICIGGAVIKAYRFRSTSFGENTIKLGIMAAVLMTLLHATVDFPLQIPSLQLYFATFLGLLWSAGEGTASTRRRSSSSALPSVL